MELTKRTLWLSIAAVIGVQTAVLAWMVWGRVHLLTSGREITLKVVPVDPRDIFRGDYVILGYTLSPLTRVEARDGALPAGLRTNGPIYVTITPDAESGWAVAGIADAYPTALKAGDAVLKGRVTDLYGDPNSGGHTIRVRYGIESYFVPEGEGREIEQQVRDKKVEALVAIGSDGTAALKGLIVDGKRIHEQPVL